MDRLTDLMVDAVVATADTALTMLETEAERRSEQMEEMVNGLVAMLSDELEMVMVVRDQFMELVEEGGGGGGGPAEKLERNFNSTQVRSFMRSGASLFIINLPVQLVYQ